MNNQNIYNQYIEEFLERAAFLQGSIYHLSKDINKYREVYIESRQSNIDLDFRLGTHLVISDITGPTDNGWHYVYSTNEGYTVKLTDYDDQNSRLINEYTSFTILQSYEAFRRFLKSILARYYFENQDMVVKHKLLKFKKRNRIIRFWNQLLHSRQNFEQEFIFQNMELGKYNSNLFKCLRRLSEHYRKHEKKNNKNLDLIEFHKIFSICRHSITHNDSIVEKDTISRLSKNGKRILDFFATKEVKKGLLINLSQKKASRIIVVICEHVFLIYKSISLAESMNWKILKNMR